MGSLKGAVLASLVLGSAVAGAQAQTDSSVTVWRVGPFAGPQRPVLQYPSDILACSSWPVYANPLPPTQAAYNYTFAYAKGRPSPSNVSDCYSQLVLATDNTTPYAEPRIQGNAFSYAACPPGYASSTCVAAGADPNLNKGKPDCACTTASNADERVPLEGNPINPLVGNKFQIDRDYVGGGMFPLDIERSYNSFGSAPGSPLGFGAAASGSTDWSGFVPKYVQPSGPSSFGNVAIDFGWRLSYDRTVTVRSGTNASATLYRGDSKTRTFTLVNGAWVPNSGQLMTSLRQQSDSNGNAVGYVYINENDETEKYDASGRLVSITSRSGQTQTLQYNNAFNSLSSVSDAFGRKLTLSYNGSGFLAGLTDPSGGKYGYTYDGNGNLSSVIYPDGRSRQYVYENTKFVHALTGVIDENGARFATWSYDSQGSAIGSEHAGGVDRVVISYPTATSSTSTDAGGATRIYATQVVNGIAKAGAINETAGNVIRSRSQTYDAHGNLATSTDYNGTLTTYQYDLTRDLETSRVEAAGTSKARTMTTVWHPAWRQPVKIVEPNRIVTLSYNGDGGNFCAPSTALSNDQPIGVLCQKTEQATSDATGSQGISAAVIGFPEIWRYTYSADGQMLTASGPRTDINDVTTYAYRTVDDPTLPPQYRRGDLYSVTNALGHVTTVDRHDAHGRPLRMTDANGTVTTLSYSPRGWLTSRTVAPAMGTGQITTYDYDNAGQLTRMTQPDGSYVAYSYDGAHRLTMVADSQGNSIVYALDAMGNRTQEQVKDPMGALARQVSRTFSSVNLPLAVTIGAAP